MKRILLSLVAVAALSFGGLFTSSAQAHGPYCGGPYVNYGYRGYGLYNGYMPYGAYVPYGAGYSGGWQPYQGFYHQQPRVGFYFGF
jgi:hypothetical protein